MSHMMETRSYCPHFDFRPEDYHGFNLIPFQGKMECSEHCVNFASFLAEEATGYPYLPPPSGQLQDWVRRSLQAYAPLFTRTITAIPAELIPLGSHISNIDMQIEGRLTAIDLQKDEATFKLDKTSAKKLEVFHTELTGREADSELTQKLSELEVKMAMIGVVGYNLLGFRDVVGGLFNIDGQNTSVSHEEVQHKRDLFHDIKDEWAGFCQSFYEQQEGRFSPAQYETDYDDWGSLQVAVGDYSDDGQLETFPEDGSASPQDYWGSTLPQLHIIEGAVEPPRQFDFRCSHLQGHMHEVPSTITSPKTSFSQPHRGTPKAYGGLGYTKPLRVLRIPPTPSLVSCVDISSPSLFSLPDPVYPRPTLGDRESQRKSSNSSLSLRTNISAIATHGSVADLEQGPTPSTRTSSVDSTSEVMTSSGASTHSHPSIYDAFPTTLLASDSISQASDAIVFSPCSSIWEVGALQNGLQWNELETRHKSNLKKLPTIRGREMENVQGIGLIGAGDECHSGHSMAIETEDLDEYGFELEDEGEFAPLQTKIEKEQDPTTVIIQGKVEAMLDAAQSQGFVYKATRDGLDNHPISVRLRSISGNHSSMKEILGERRSSFASNDNVSEARAMELADNQVVESESPPFAVRGADSTPDDYQPSIISDTPSSKSCRDMGQTQPRNQNFSEYKAGVRSATDRLRELKLKFEREGEQILGSYYRTLKRIQILETEILKSESLEGGTLENKAREMIEFCGYDESAFTEEGSLANFPQKSKNYMEDYTVHEDVQNSIVSGGEGRVGPDAGIIDGAHSKADCARPLKVRTKFCANYTNPKEISPCCHFGKRSKGACLEELNIRCAHGMMREVKQLSNSSSTITSPSGGADLWRLNYTFGGQRDRAMRAYEEDCANCNSRIQCGMSEGGEPDRPRKSFSGTDVPKPIEKRLPISYPLTSTICSPESWAMQPPVEIDAAVTKDYYDKLTEYYKSAHGDTVQKDGRASYESINPSTKENFGMGYEKTTRNS